MIKMDDVINGRIGQQPLGRDSSGQVHKHVLSERASETTRRGRSGDVASECEGEGLGGLNEDHYFQARGIRSCMCQDKVWGYG